MTGLMKWKHLKVNRFTSSIDYSFDEFSLGPSFLKQFISEKLIWDYLFFRLLTILAVLCLLCFNTSARPGNPSSKRKISLHVYLCKGILFLCFSSCFSFYDHLNLYSWNLMQLWCKDYHREKYQSIAFWWWSGLSPEYFPKTHIFASKR